MTSDEPTRAAAEDTVLVPPIAPGDTYETDLSRRRPALSRIFLSSPRTFYLQAFWIVLKASRKAQRGDYDRGDWVASSKEILRALENVGVRFHVSGLANIASLDSPVVFVCNHMSTLETFVLPCLIGPFRPVTFVVKKSLLTYPVFGPIMRSRNPVAVGRENPREDLTTVLREGTEKLGAGISLVIFPQTTRTTVFDPAHFNTLGIKVAARAGVPVVPVAVRTDAWGNGKHFKDFGPVNPFLPVHIAFGKALTVEGKGADTHQKVIEFVASRLAGWGLPATDPH